MPIQVLLGVQPLFRYIKYLNRGMFPFFRKPRAWWMFDVDDDHPEILSGVELIVCLFSLAEVYLDLSLLLLQRHCRKHVAFYSFKLLWRCIPYVCSRRD